MYYVYIWIDKQNTIGYNWVGSLNNGFLQTERSPYSPAIIKDSFKLLAVHESLIWLKNVNII